MRFRIWYDRAVLPPPRGPLPRLARGLRLLRVFITLAASLALAGCDRCADESGAAASPKPEPSPEKSEPAPPEDSPAAENGGAEPGTGAASTTLIVDGPMRVEFPSGFPEPVAHRDEGELRGFSFSTTTYESFSEHLGLVAASASEYAPNAFDELTPADMLDGVKQTLLIELGGDITREERREKDDRHTLDLVLRAELGGRDAHIRVVAHLAAPHLVQALLISPFEGGTRDEVARDFFDSLEIDRQGVRDRGLHEPEEP